MADDKQQILKGIEKTVKTYTQGGKVKIEGDAVNFSVPMKFSDDAKPSPINFSSQVHDGYVQTFCVMTMDFFDCKGKEPSLDFYKLMNILNLRMKSSCCYFYTEGALVCSAVAPTVAGFNGEAYWFNTYNLLDTVGRFTPSFYGLLNGHVTYDELLKIYQENDL